MKLDISLPNLEFILQYVLENPEEGKEVLKNIRTQDLNQSQYNYYLTCEEVVDYLISYIFTNKVKGFLEIGSGLGILSRLIAKNTFCRKIVNIEINPTLSALSHKLNRIDAPTILTFTKDALEISQEDLKGINLVYLYEPFLPTEDGKKKKTKFLKNLLALMPADCVLIYLEVSEILPGFKKYHEYFFASGVRVSMYKKKKI